MNKPNSRQQPVLRAFAARMRRFACVVVATAAATSVVCVTVYAAVSQIIGVGVLEHSAFGGPATITMRTLTIAPGEVLGWHYHPGAGAYTIVTTGALTVEDGCGGETVYTAGQAFLEPPLRVHRGKNLTANPVVTAQTFIVPVPGSSSVSTGQLCGVPIEIDECRGDGWMAFNHPRSFVNQGECVEYVVTNKLREHGLQ